MKTLVVYYSLTGNTKLIAETISKELSADIESIKPEKPVNQKGFKKYLIAGKQALLKEKPAIEPLIINPDDYDIIIIGSPVWAGTFASYIKTFLSKYIFADKKIAVFCCHGGGGNGKLFKNIKKELKACQFIGEIEFKDPLKKRTDLAITKAKEWCIEILNNNQENI